MNKQSSNALLSAGLLMCIMGLCGILVPHTVGEGMVSYLYALFHHMSGSTPLIPLHMRIEQRDAVGLLIPWLLTMLGATTMTIGWRER